MKKIYLLVHLLLVSSLTNAQQWLGSSTPYGTIYRADKIKVGYGPLYLDWTYQQNWGGDASKWAGYVGFNAYRNSNDAKDYYYGENAYTSKSVFEGSNAGFRWLYRATVNNDSQSQHLLNELMVLDPSGRLGIGTTSPDYKLTVNGGIRSFLSTSGDNFELQNSRILADRIQGLKVQATSTNTNKLVFGVLGYATSSYNLPGVATAIGVYGEASSPAGSYAGFFNGNLAYTGNFGFVSDKNLKENIKELPASLDIIMKMRPKQYTYKKFEGLNFPAGDQAGLIAQDIEELLPNLVNHNGLPLPDSPNVSDSISNESTPEKYLTLNYIGLIPYIVKSIQEQQEIIEKQNSLIQAILLKDTVSSSTALTKDIPHIVKLYPNPAQTQLDIECFTNGLVATIYIYNKEGKVYKSLTLDNTSTAISLETFESGIYIVALFINGTAFDVKRFMVFK